MLLIDSNELEGRPWALVLTRRRLLSIKESCAGELEVTRTTYLAVLRRKTSFSMKDNIVSVTLTFTYVPVGDERWQTMASWLNALFIWRAIVWATTAHLDRAKTIKLNVSSFYVRVSCNLRMRGWPFWSRQTRADRASYGDHSYWFRIFTPKNLTVAEFREVRLYGAAP